MTLSTALAALALLAATGLTLAAACAVAASAFWPTIEQNTSSWHPQSRFRLYSALAISPIAIPIVALLLCLSPGLIAHWTGHQDHCASHLGHPHLCLIHPSIALSPPLALLLIFFVAGLSLGILRAIRWTLRARREQGLLRAHSSRHLARDVSIVAAPEIFALTGGFFRMRIWLSSGLEDVLTSRELDVVLAHERAHAELRDPLRGWFAMVFSSAHLPATRRAILLALKLASEQTCDERAARVVGDRLSVAETLIRLEGLTHRRTSTQVIATATSAIAGSTVPERVRRLLAAEAREPARIFVSPMLLVGVVFCLLLVEPLHHLTEHVIGAIYDLL